MLVLTRRAGEAIMIGHAVKVVVKRISGSRVALAIEADAEVPIRRGELYEWPSGEATGGNPRPESKTDPLAAGSD